MKIKFIQDEDVVNYKKISMIIGMPYCDGKCWRKLNEKEPGKYDWSLCQNSSLLNNPIIDIEIETLVERYLNNPLTHAIVFAGMEPLLSQEDMIEFLHELRAGHECNDDVVIYTGYEEDSDEVVRFIEALHRQKIENVIIKFGRYVPGQTEHYDSVLGVNLISWNQYAKKIC